MSNTEQLTDNTEKIIGTSLMNQIIDKLLEIINTKKDLLPKISSTMTIYSGAWSDGDDTTLDPYTYTTSTITGVTDTSNVEVTLSESLTDREYKSQIAIFENAKIHRITPNSDGTIVLKCFGTKPTIDMKLDVHIR